MATRDDRPASRDEATRLAVAKTIERRTGADMTSPLTDPAQAATEALTAMAEELANASSEVVTVGSVLKNRFVLEEMLGRGGMGVVYKARDQRKVEAMDREPYIAVKVLSKDFQANPDSFIALQRESKKAQQLAHPNIVTVYDFDRDGPNVFMTMELLEGEPLDELIRRLRPGTLPFQQALSIIEQMSRALAYAHSEKIVHSDFKPGNIFLTSKNVIKVVDFGIARAAKDSDRVVEDATVFDPGSLGALTPTYASCEMLEHGAPDPRDDVYGLAVVSYELLAGSHPFDRKPATYARDLELKPPRPKELPKEIWHAIFHGLAFEREKRTVDATQFLREMSGPRAGRDSARPKWIIPVVLSGALSLVVIIGAMLFFAQQNGIQPERLLEDTATLDAGAREKVGSLLEVAEVHVLVGRYLEPPGSSAYDAYQQILVMHQNNRQAVEGLQQLGDHIEESVREYLRAGDREEGLKQLSKALDSLPRHQGLLDLKDQLDDRANQ
ncbi:MAG: serine/threonine protein kinase [Candidatus Thiodiazotropha sp. (ex Epidulcina cf. delphinae)]|nr:serine/threonine protein kinase [Candidatus Thiodiazotropha sp. (ex Epidulcina cf. delphinae)]